MFNYGSVSNYGNLGDLASGDVSLLIISVFLIGVSLFAYVLLTLNMAMVVGKKPTLITVFALLHTVILGGNVFLALLSRLVPGLDCGNVGVAYGVLLGLGLALKHAVFLMRSMAVLKSKETFPTVMRIGVFSIVLYLALTIAGFALTPTYQDIFGACGFQTLQPLVVFSSSLNIINDVYFVFLFLIPLYRHILSSKLNSNSLMSVFEEGLSSVAISSVVSLVTLIALNLSFQPELFVLIQIADFTISSICVSLMFARRKKVYSQNERKYVVKQFFVSRRARAKQLYALLLMGACTIGAQVAIYALLKNNDSTRVNIAGRQRMLSQQLVADAYESVYFSAKNSSLAPSYLTILPTTLELWQSSQLGLIYGSVDLDLIPETDGNVLAMFKKIQPIQQKMLVTLDNFDFYLSNTPGITFDDPIARASLNTLSSNRLPFLTQMNDIVTVLQNRSSTQELVIQVLVIEYVLAAISILAALFQLNIIARKSYGRMRAVTASQDSSKASGLTGSTAAQGKLEVKTTSSRHGPSRVQTQSRTGTDSEPEVVKK